MTPISPEVLEANYLDALWVVKEDTRAMRLRVLKWLAGVVIQRESGWDSASVRLAELPITLDNRCFVCRTQEMRLYRHHAIQVQHGGSNDRRNLVSLCHACHRDIHPWLVPSSTLERRGGWTSMSDLAQRVMDWLGIPRPEPTPELPQGGADDAA